MNEPLPEDLKVTVLGLGIMGRALAMNLHEDGMLAACWNRSPRTGVPMYVEDLGEAVASASVLFIVVIDGAAVLELVDKISPMLTNEHIVVQTATVKPQENIEASKRVESAGANFVEALMGGSEVAAVQRKLPLYLGGEKELADYLDPVLALLSPARLYVGEVGQASVAKLAMNLNLAMQLEALCESYAYAIANGLNDDQYFDVLRNNTGWNYLCEYKEPKLRQRDFAPQFALKNMLKDVRLALATDTTRSGLSLLKATEKIYAAGDKAGLGEEDMLALYKLINDKD
ncbi:MAG: NAD(P)-dependent oxidoreductase [Gammaproteobacteria bacterium]